MCRKFLSISRNSMPRRGVVSRQPRPPGRLAGTVERDYTPRCSVKPLMPGDGAENAERIPATSRKTRTAAPRLLSTRSTPGGRVRFRAIALRLRDAGMGAETSNCIALSSRGVSQRSDASARTVTDAWPYAERDTTHRVANREIYAAWQRRYRLRRESAAALD